jgi:membrane protein YqaA with SNARE-associated domain
VSESWLFVREHVGTWSHSNKKKLMQHVFKIEQISLLPKYITFLPFVHVVCADAGCLEVNILSNGAGSCIL